MLTMAAEKKEKVTRSQYQAEMYQRLGKKSLTIWVPKDMPKALKLLAIENDTSLQDLVTGFINDGLERKGKSRIE